MPRREDISTILIVGSGPIVIGQGCEFDYAGAQACKALKAEGYRVVLVNSNPATIMTDPGLSDRTYIEPITPEAVRKVIEKEARLGPPIDAILPTLGGQTALNIACALHDAGDLDRLGVEMIGASRDAIRKAEDRQAFKDVVASVGLKTPESRIVSTVDDGLAFLDEVGLPAILRPAFTLGGWGGGVAYNRDEFEDLLRRGLAESMINQVEVDRSVIGWKEYELEVIRDKRDNCIIVCGIENVDPMGVHTGDSITVAPILTLTDREYQAMRDAAFAVIRAVGVETGGSNVQFAVDPDSGDMLVVEMNPRVSRSSALASKATGFPIAKVAARLAVGYTLDELRNDITGATSACFEPAIDYIVTKMPRWTFEKFPEADETLTTQMKSVGEAMAIGRTFAESLQKAIRSMEVKRFGLGLDDNDGWLARLRGETPAPGALDTEFPVPEDKLTRKLAQPSQGRLHYIRYAFKQGWPIERIRELTRIDPFFLEQIERLTRFEDRLLARKSLDDAPRELLFEAKRLGYSDHQLAKVFLGDISTETILKVRGRRKTLGIEPVYKLVDTCAAEFEAATPYYYSTYEAPARMIDADGRSRELPPEDEIRVSEKRKIVILGGGPNRIGQGIEFDYCCVHAAFACAEAGFESVMINSNPETVSTDYDTSDLLFFEPLTLEDSLNIIERLNASSLPLGEGLEERDASPPSPPERGAGGEGDSAGGSAPDQASDAAAGLVQGVIVQFGGQTPLNLAHGLAAAGAPIIGTSLDSIDRAEDRERFRELLERLNLRQPDSAIARSVGEAIAVARDIGYPVLVRPSYVLGGRGMELCPDETAMRRYMQAAVGASDLRDAPVLIDRFLADATEVDVDLVADFDPDDATAAGGAIVCGVMEHVEHAGVHSGDSTCAVPPFSLSRPTIQRIRDSARSLARELRVRGLMNVQAAVKDDEIYILEVNPRASRTAPFVSKATGVSWPFVAARVMMGASLDALDVRERDALPHFAVKESVFPFRKFPRVDFVLGPEMRSTGEVMGVDPSLPIAFAKAQMAAGVDLPTAGSVFLSVRDEDKARLIDAARSLRAMGFTIYTTGGTSAALRTHSVQAIEIKKIAEGARPNVLDMMTNGEIDLVINTPTRVGWATDEGKIRALAVRLNLPMLTTASGALAAVRAIEALRAGDWSVAALQDARFDESAAQPRADAASLPTPSPA